MSSQASSAGCPPTAPLSTSAAARASRRPRLLSARHRVLGVDLSLVKLRLPRQAAPRAALVRADMTELDLRTGSVDAVASFYALGRVRPAAHAPLLRFIARWLRPGGLLLTSAPLTADDAVDSEWLARRCTSAASGSRPPLPRLRPPAWSSTAAGRTRGQRPSPSPSSPRTRPPHRPPAAPARRPAGTPRPGPARSTTPAAESPARSRPRPLRAQRLDTAHPAAGAWRRLAAQVVGHRMPGLVDLEVRPARQPDRGEHPPALLADRPCGLDAVGGELLQRARDVVAH